MKFAVMLYIEKRGSFTEVSKSNDVGQSSINVSKTATTKDQHWNYSNNHKFLVIYGYGKIEIPVLLRMKPMFILF